MAVVWHNIDNRLTHEYLPYPIMGTLMQDPYPPFWWYVEDSKLKNRFLGDRIYHGAFCNCTELKTAEIPASVKYIGDYAFYNTALTAVTIASDCEYSNTSFPPRCTINFYLT